VPRCAAEGILGTVTGLLGVLQANEVLKLLLGFPSSLEGKLLWVDALSLRLEEIRLKKNPQCAICGRRPAITRLIDYEAFCKGVSSGERGA
jgi:adenylyltransferase/sulfurtransferase